MSSQKYIITLKYLIQVKSLEMFEHEFDKKEIEEALPQYQYVKKLGSGAFAVVHLVKNRTTSEQLAVKKVACFGMSEFQRAGAANQARILSSLDHKNVIKVKSCLFDNNEDIMYIFMQYAQSGDLSVLIQQARQKKKRIPENTIWKIVADVSDAIRYLHQNQIIHRDIKPANIFRMGKSFKLADMNVSKVIKSGVVASTKTGSPLYTAPQVWNHEEYGYQCDVWSLGVLVYELCTLRVPYQADTIIQLTRKISQTKPKSLPTIYSPFLDDLIKKMLQPNPLKRISPEQILKIASAKLKIQTESLDQEGTDNLMDTIVFPDTHQRWINLIPSPLPPKTCRKDIAKSQIVQDKTKSNEKQKNEDCQLMVVSNAFRSSQKKVVNIPNSKSKGKAENKQLPKLQVKNELKVPSLPPIYRSNSPMAPRKKPAETKQRSFEKRQRSTSRTKRQSAIELVIESKSILNTRDE